MAFITIAFILAAGAALAGEPKKAAQPRPASKNREGGTQPRPAAKEKEKEKDAPAARFTPPKQRVEQAPKAGPLYESEPYDLITLNAANENVEIQVVPLAERQLPEKPRPNKTLTIRLLDDPSKEYELEWGSVAKVELFEHRVLAEAKQRVAEQRFDDAFDYFQYLLAHYPTLDGLSQLIEDSLFEEAKALQKKGRLDTVLARLDELYRRNPRRPGLQEMIAETLGEIYERHAAAGHYRTLRALLKSTGAMYPGLPLVAQWESKLREQAAAALAEAKTAAAAGKYREAYKAARRLVDIWPDLPKAQRELSAIFAAYTQVVVGVSEPGVVACPGELNGWAARRTGRLVQRTLTEFTGASDEGGAYATPLGSIEVEELGLRLVIGLKRNLRAAPGGESLTGYELSRRLLALADPADPSYRVEWGEILGSVTVNDVYSLQADLLRPHVRPQALLQVPLADAAQPGKADAPSPNFAPYLLKSRADEDTTYVANADYFIEGTTRPKEIVERLFTSEDNAVEALQRGQIDVLDRVSPWKVPSLMDDPNVVVEPYGAPLVHCLIPNPNRPLVSNRVFRRGLVYGIHRQAILRTLVGGKDLPGCLVLSGPFSSGSSRGDALAYAVDPTILPWPYDPRLGMGLTRVGFTQWATEMRQEGKPVEKMPTLILSHPAHEAARLACKAIQRQLALIKVPVELRELPPGMPGRLDDKTDLLYAELAVWEPAVDARRLLDRDGLTGFASPYMSLALRKLEQATDWPQLSPLLQQIHLLAHREVSVIPLWQMTEHYAYRHNVDGIGPRPVTLYQNVDSWQVSSVYRSSAEKP